MGKLLSSQPVEVLTKVLDDTSDAVPPFHYHHLGSLAYIGRLPCFLHQYLICFIIISSCHLLIFSIIFPLRGLVVCSWQGLSQLIVRCPSQEGVDTSGSVPGNDVPCFRCLLLLACLADFGTQTDFLPDYGGRLIFESTLMRAVL